MHYFPPYESLYQVAQNYPKAVFQYLWLFREKKDENIFKSHKLFITEEFSWKSFRDNLKLLHRLNLINYSITPAEKVTITFKEKSEQVA